jgi:hypothetical protein
LKTMTAATLPPDELSPLSAERTGLRPTPPRQPRWVWLAVGAAAAGSFATVLLWLVLR